MIQPVSAVEPKAIARFNDWVRIRIDVLDNNTVYVGMSKADLQSGLLATLGGIPVDKTHPYNDWVKGEVWWIASVDNTLCNLVVWPSLVSIPG